jgi:serine/threonine-protein phosphatase 2B catalytic subunit
MELKNVTGTGKLPYGTLALGAEGIKKGTNSLMKFEVRITA